MCNHIGRAICSQQPFNFTEQNQPIWSPQVPCEKKHKVGEIKMTQSHQSYAELLGSLDVDMRLRKAIARMGIVKPTLVQEQCLDLAIAKGRDIVCKARTGRYEQYIAPWISLTLEY